MRPAFPAGAGMVRLMVAGSRHLTTDAPVRRLLEQYNPNATIVIVGDDTRGCDALVLAVCQEMKFTVRQFVTHWDTQGVKAGDNQRFRMVQLGKPHKMVAICVNKVANRNAIDAYRKAVHAGVPSQLILVEEDGSEVRRGA